jgi:hypothetical protein
VKSTHSAAVPLLEEFAELEICLMRAAEAVRDDDPVGLGRVVCDMSLRMDEIGRLSRGFFHEEEK